MTNPKIAELALVLAEETTAKAALANLEAEKARIAQEIESINARRLDLGNKLLEDVKVLLRTTGHVMSWQATKNDGKSFVYIEGPNAFAFSPRFFNDKDCFRTHNPSAAILAPGLNWIGGELEKDFDNFLFARDLRNAGVTYFVYRAGGVNWDAMRTYGVDYQIWERTDVRPVKAMEAFPELFAEEFPVIE